MSANDIVAAVEPVVVAFEKLGVVYRIGGSVASSVLGVPRSTLDVDLVCNLSTGSVGAFVADLRDSYYVDADMIREAIDRRASFNLVHLETMVKIDVFIRKTGPWHEEAFSRCLRKTLDVAPGARAFDITTAEDIILHKLVWYRLGDGIADRQLRDVIGVMAVQGDQLDWSYLAHWAAHLELGELLKRAREEATC